MMELTLLEPILACEPMTLMALSLTLTAAGTAASYVGQKQQASAQKDYQEELAAMQQKAAMEKNKSTRIQQIQAAEAAYKKNRSVALQAENLAAEGRLSSAAGGVTGLSMIHLQQAQEAAEGRFYHTMEVEAAWRDSAYQDKVETTLLTAAQQMRATRSIVSEPNALAMGLQAGAQMAGTGAQMMEMKQEESFRKSMLKKSKTPKAGA